MSLYNIVPGEIIHSWTIEEVLFDNPEKPTIMGSSAICRCVCGTRKKVKVHDLRYGRVKSCGCAMKKPASESITNDWKKAKRRKAYERQLWRENKVPKDKRIEKQTNDNIDLSQTYGTLLKLFTKPKV